MYVGLERSLGSKVFYHLEESVSVSLIRGDFQFLQVCAKILMEKAETLSPPAGFVEYSHP